MGIVNNVLKFSIIFTDSSNTIFQCFVYLHQNKVQRNIEKIKKNSFFFFCVCEQEKNVQGNQDIYCTTCWQLGKQ